MIINLPGVIRVQNLAKELAPVSTALVEAEADTLTGVAISLQQSWNDSSGRTAGERRLMQYPGSMKTTDLPTLVVAAVKLLEMNGIEAVSEIEISLQAWRGDERAQIWGEDGFIKRMFFDQASEAEGVELTRVLRAGTAIKYRPNDKEVNLLAVMFGHDD